MKFLNRFEEDTVAKSEKKLAEKALKEKHRRVAEVTSGNRL